MSGDLSRERPWEDLSPDIAAVLRPALPGLTEAIIAAISASIPEYKRPIEGAFGSLGSIFGMLIAVLIVLGAIVGPLIAAVLGIRFVTRRMNAGASEA